MARPAHTSCTLPSQVAALKTGSRLGSFEILALLGTGAVVGILSGASPLKRALRQLAIGFGAAAVTYGLGLLFGAALR